MSGKEPTTATKAETKAETKAASGFGGLVASSRTFLLVWLGQLVSVVGSAMTGFALVVWVYRQTGEVTEVALVSLFLVLPGILVAPFAGVVVDRWDRRWVMLLSDMGAGLATLVVAGLYFTGYLEVWHTWALVAAGSFFNAFQWPAYAAAVTLLVPKRHLARANGMVQMGQGLGQLLAPLLGGVLVVALGVGWVVLIDFATFLFAATTLILVRFPTPPESKQGKESEGASIWRQAAFGLSYLRRRKPLVGLLSLTAVSNFLQGLVLVLGAPLVLSFYDAQVLGIVSSVGGVGMLVGSIVMSGWGGPRWRIAGVMGFLALGGAFLILFGTVPSPWVWSLAGFGFLFTMPVVRGCSQAIWQSKVEPDVQGKVFALRRMVALSATPISYLLAGPLADGLFEPWMAAGGPLAETVVGQLMGTGPGRGIGLMFIAVGLLVILVVSLAWAWRPLRHIEQAIPDAIPEDLPEKKPTSSPAVSGESEPVPG